MIKKLFKISSLTFISLFGLTSCDTKMIEERVNGVVNSMLPNLYVTITQLALFILTVVVFYFLAYKPLRKKLDARATYVKNNIDESNRKNEEASENLKKSEEIIFDSQKKAGQIIQDAQVSAEKKAAAVEKELNRAIEDQKAQAHKDIQAEKIKMLKEAKSEIVESAISTSKEILKREIVKEDSDRFIDDLIKNLNEEAKNE